MQNETQTAQQKSLSLLRGAWEARGPKDMR